MVGALRELVIDALGSGALHPHLSGTCENLSGDQEGQQHGEERIERGFATDEVRLVGAVRRSVVVGVVLVEGNVLSGGLGVVARDGVQDALSRTVRGDEFPHRRAFRRGVLRMAVVVVEARPADEHAVGAEGNVGGGWPARLLESRVDGVDRQMVDGESAQVAPRVFVGVIPPGHVAEMARAHQRGGLVDQIAGPFAFDQDSVFRFQPDHARAVYRCARRSPARDQAHPAAASRAVRWNASARAGYKSRYRGYQRA